MNSIRLKKVVVEKNHPYTLKIIYNQIKDYGSKQHILSYTGSSVIAEDMCLNEEAERKIKEQIRDIFGDGPFEQRYVVKCLKESDALVQW